MPSITEPTLLNLLNLRSNALTTNTTPHTTLTKHKTNHPNINNDTNKYSKMEEDNQAPPRRSKRKVMKQSTQTDAERRALRIKQRSLKSLLTSNNSQLSEQIADVSSNKFKSTRDDNNKLYEQVSYTREAVLDAENVELLSNRTARQVDKLIEVPRYDVEKFIHKLKKSCSSGNGSSGAFQWHSFGYEVGCCFNALPSNVSFMNGPLDSEYQVKQRKKTERRKRESYEDVEEEEVGSVQQKKRSKDEDKLSAAEKQVSTIRKLLQKKSMEHVNERFAMHAEKCNKDQEEWNMDEKTDFRDNNRDKGEVDGMQFLFNPKSFTQTVENLFSLSFLVKQGSAKIGVRKPEDCKSEHARPGLYVKPKDADDDKKKQKKSTCTQAIVSLSMADWRALVEAHELEDGDIPHRGKSKYAKKQSPSK